jgi:hypothetical protein
VALASACVEHSLSASSEPVSAAAPAYVMATARRACRIVCSTIDTVGSKGPAEAER